jgi:hypothetical protein
MHFLSHDPKSAEPTTIDAPIEERPTDQPLFDYPPDYNELGNEDWPALDDQRQPSPPRRPVDLAMRARAGLDRLRSEGVQRKIATVIDTSAPEGHGQRSAAAVLDVLTAAGFVAFRREVRRARDAGKARWCCAACGQPVYAAGSADVEAYGDGRQAYFSHFAGGAAHCALGVEARSIAAINAEKFDGAAESAEHFRLKAMLDQMLRADAGIFDVRVEGVMAGAEGWRKPDVAARIGARQAVFEIQLARPHLPDIVAREAFYSHERVHLFWLTTPARLVQMARQGFQDIFWHNKGQILAIDAEAYAATLRTGELHLWAMTVLPTLIDGRIVNRWSRRLVQRTHLSLMTGSRRPRFDGDDYIRAFVLAIEDAVQDLPEAILEAVTGNDAMARIAVRSAWTQAAAVLDIGSWQAAQADGMFEALGALATLASAEKADATPYRMVPTIIDRFLNTDIGASWTNVLLEVATAYGRRYLLTRPETQRLIAANLAGSDADLGRKHELALSTFFPGMALTRLGTVPAAPRDGSR